MQRIRLMNKNEATKILWEIIDNEYEGNVSAFSRDIKMNYQCVHIVLKRTKKISCALLWRINKVEKLQKYMDRLIANSRA